MVDVFFERASNDYLDFCYNLRNEEMSVKYSNKGIIPYDVYKEKYFENINNSILIVKKGKYTKSNYKDVFLNDVIGYVIFEDIGEGFYEISIAIIPSERGKGYGTAILEEAYNDMFNNYFAKAIIAKLYSNNIGSKKIFEKAGYKLINTNQKIDDIRGSLLTYIRLNDFRVVEGRIYYDSKKE